MSIDCRMHTNSANTKPQWSILYRGPLSSCNYGCAYCPFAKTKNTREELADDAKRLARFVEWVSTQTDRRIGILFTPWGEALIRRPYREAMCTLSHMPHVYRVAAQTNLSWPMEWLEECDKTSLALWCTYHPTETSREAFVARSHRLHQMGIRHSIGVVGLKEHFDDIDALRNELPTSTYMWINAYKRQPDYYTEDDLTRLTSVDPLFSYNTRYHPSVGRSCRAGASAFTVDGDGTARRCHFIPEPLGNIYETDFSANLQERLCSNQTCGCHIGYIHLDALQLYPVYGDGLLERIPATDIWSHR